MAASSSPQRTHWWAVLLGALLVVGIAVFAWWSAHPPPVPPPVDVVALMQLNNRGIGLMEQYQYDKAADAFAEAARLDARWLPGQINLAIARLNQAQPESLAEATHLLQSVLQRDPDSRHALYCLGIILHFEGKEPERAAKYFEAVTRLDPDDAHAWYYLGLTRLGEQKTDDARACFEKALQRNPYLLGAMNNLQLLLRRQPDQKARADELLQRFQKLQAADWYTRADMRYGEMGRYADAIGRPLDASASTGPLPVFLREESLRVELAPATRWARPADLGKGIEGDLLRAVRTRFGGAFVVLDIDQDGKPDLLLLAAVMDDGRVRDLLLHNEGGGRFRDVTAEAGLVGPHAGLACAVADVDNDGLPDLLITTAAGPRLLRSKDGHGFEDITKGAGLDTVKDVCLGATFVDIDQDGDLDLVLARTAADPAQAVAALSKPPQRGSGPLLLLNVGTAPPQSGKKPVPLELKFQPGKLPEVPSSTLQVLASDLDNDGDMDLLVLGAGGAPQVILNDRLLTFHTHPLPDRVTGAGAWTRGLILDADGDQRSDLFLVGHGQQPALLLQRGRPGADWFGAGRTNSPPLVQAQAADIDLDGRTDIVGLSDKRRPVLLHNDGQRLTHVREALGSDADWPAGIIALTVTDADGDGFPDFFLWSEEGLRLYRGQTNGNHGLALQVSGQRDQALSLRTNRDGIGTRVLAQAINTRASVELTAHQAGLGQSSQPLLLGLGPATAADFVSLRWPDGVWQAELNVPSGQLAVIKETSRKTVSCPLLFAWDGSKFSFVTDFLGAGSVGEPLPGGGHRQPRPEESVKIEASQLIARDGSFTIKLAEPMDEVTYLDRLQLWVVDHDAGLQVFPDERFVADPRGPSQDLLIFDSARRIFPITARDHRGRDVTDVLRRWDRITVDGFSPRSWVGFAEEHEVELDFGDRLATLDPRQPVSLFLAGWTDYPLPESIWAAAQAGQGVQGPVLERMDSHGHWQTLLPELGFPAGLPRMIAADVTGQLSGPTCHLRIRTNMHVFWDQIFVAPLRRRLPADNAIRSDESIRLTPLEVQQATLQVRGCVRESTPDGREPTLYDYDRLEPIAVTRLAGRLTRCGDVTELLQKRDDCFVIFGAGDEVTITFDATRLPPLRSGWRRSYILRSWGYCKDAGPFTATGGTVEPLPFAAMSNYPYAPHEHYPRTPRHQEYLQRYQTRQIGPQR